MNKETKQNVQILVRKYLFPNILMVNESKKKRRITEAWSTNTEHSSCEE